MITESSSIKVCHPQGALTASAACSVFQELHQHQTALTMGSLVVMHGPGVMLDLWAEVGSVALPLAWVVAGGWMEDSWAPAQGKPLCLKGKQCCKGRELGAMWLYWSWICPKRVSFGWGQSIFAQQRFCHTGSADGRSAQICCDPCELHKLIQKMFYTETFINSLLHQYSSFLSCRSYKGKSNETSQIWMQKILKSRRFNLIFLLHIFGTLIIPPPALQAFIYLRKIILLITRLQLHFHCLELFFFFNSSCYTCVTCKVS